MYAPPRGAGRLEQRRELRVLGLVGREVVCLERPSGSDRSVTSFQKSASESLSGTAGVSTPERSPPGIEHKDEAEAGEADGQIDLIPLPRLAHFRMNPIFDPVENPPLDGIHHLTVDGIVKCGGHRRRGPSCRCGRSGLPLDTSPGLTPIDERCA